MSAGTMQSSPPPHVDGIERSGMGVLGTQTPTQQVQPYFQQMHQGMDNMQQAMKQLEQVQLPGNQYQGGGNYGGAYTGGYQTPGGKSGGGMGFGNSKSITTGAQPTYLQPGMADQINAQKNFFTGGTAHLQAYPADIFGSSPNYNQLAQFGQAGPAASEGPVMF